MKSLPFILLICLFLGNCAEKPPEKKPEKTETDRPQLVGRIASIPASREFVLIQAYGKWLVETGSILTTQGPGGRAANLRATGEKLGQYAAADVQSGTLEVGDGVYTALKIKEPPSELDTEPSPPEKSLPLPPEEAEPTDTGSQPKKDSSGT